VSENKFNQQNYSVFIKIFFGSIKAAISMFISKDMSARSDPLKKRIVFFLQNGVVYSEKQKVKAGELCL